MPDKLAIVIATKDRPAELRRALGSLRAQTRRPDQVVVVDGGAASAEEVVRDFPDLALNYFKASRPSAARQRNMGTAAVKPATAFIGFMDDDVVLEPRALENMMSFWESAPEKVGGAAMNMTNHPPLEWPRLKTSRLAGALGLYGSRRGHVTDAGFQTMIGPVDALTESRWLPTTAVVWRRRVLDAFRFDEWFEDYSYLEDLDLSYRIGKAFSLVVVPDARFGHFPAASGRGSGFAFGRREVRNRLHFVRRNPELSAPRCVLALCFRALLSLGLALRTGNGYSFMRFLGNLEGLAAAAIPEGRAEGRSGMGILGNSSARRRPF